MCEQQSRGSGSVGAFLRLSLEKSARERVLNLYLNLSALSPRETHHLAHSPEVLRGGRHSARCEDSRDGVLS